MFSKFLSSAFNNCLRANCFPSTLKSANITPVFKKGDRMAKENYRPVSILPNISKLFEKCIFKQLYRFFDKIFSPYQCGFRKGYNTQHCLIALIEKWKEAVDSKNSFGVLMTDLSKAFDCVVHELLIAKLEAYGLDYLSLKFLCSYLFNRKQRTKIDKN